MILGFPEYESQARRLSEALECAFEPVVVHRFPDGESRVTLPKRLPARVTFCRSLDRPNEKLIELMLAAQASRALGAQHVTLVAPYLCYMRQDMAFNPGEAVSQRIIGQFLAGLFDAVLTVDPHLHRIHDLNEVVSGGRATVLTSAPLVGEFLCQRRESPPPLLAGPDSESEQWVQAVAQSAGLSYVVAAKERLDDREVRITLPERDYAQQEVVLVDDMASTGRTMVNIAAALRARGARSIRCFVTHALHGAADARLMRNAGIENIWSSDSVTHPSNRLSLTPLLAAALDTIQ